MTLFDTHCHLTDEAFAHDAAEVFERARAAGVAAMAICGYDAASNPAAVAFAQGREGAHPTVGFHPHEAKTVTAAMLAELDALAGLPEVVAVGEIGLDFYRDHSGPAEQRRVLDAQLEIALRHGKPVSFHSRAAEDAAAEHLEPFAREMARRWPGRVPGVMHCFQGNLAQARRYVTEGFLVSIACPVTYPKNETNRTLARELPAESLVIETDSPYLPPQRLRGRRNEPANVKAAAQAIAEARGISFEDVATLTTRNAERLYRVAIRAGVHAA
ncbi:MAG: TatD family hydrolase [Dehalococcoidia bacterium]|nr:TatD family hydrolase [Dehalococcoidia bacterium]